MYLRPQYLTSSKTFVTSILPVPPSLEETQWFSSGIRVLPYSPGTVVFVRLVLVSVDFSLFISGSGYGFYKFIII